MHFTTAAALAVAALPLAAAFPNQLPLTGLTERINFGTFEMKAKFSAFFMGGPQSGATIGTQQVIISADPSSLAEYNSAQTETARLATGAPIPTLRDLFFGNYMGKFVNTFSGAPKASFETINNARGFYYLVAGVDSALLCQFRPPQNQSQTVFDGTFVGFFFRNGRPVRWYKWNQAQVPALFQTMNMIVQQRGFTTVPPPSTTSEAGFLLDAQTGELVAIGTLSSVFDGKNTVYNGFLTEALQFDSMLGLNDKQRKLLSVPVDLQTFCRA